MMEAATIYETSPNFYESSQRHIQKALILILAKLGPEISQYIYGRLRNCPFHEFSYYLWMRSDRGQMMCREWESKKYVQSFGWINCSEKATLRYLMWEGNIKWNAQTYVLNFMRSFIICTHKQQR